MIFPAARVLYLLLLLSPGFVRAETAIRSFAADFQLLLNGKLVAHAFFNLNLEPDNRYQLEVFTVPAGETRNDQQAEEVYEASSGIIRQGIPVPSRYYYSVGKGRALRTLQYSFDWPHQSVSIKGESQTERLRIRENTQDRLSYLLLAMQFSEPQEPKQITFPLLSPELSGALQLNRGEEEKIRVPAGEFQAIRIHRREQQEDRRRIYWFTATAPHLPLRIEYHGKRGMLRMELLKAYWDHNPTTQ